MPLAAVHDETVVTVEGIASPEGRLHPVQDAMVRAGGSQCGYCTPGFVVSLFCEYYRPGREGFDPESISGNLCRCTGYRPIADVARALPAPASDDPRLAELAQGAPALAAIDTTLGSHRFVRPNVVSMAVSDGTPCASSASRGSPASGAGSARATSAIGR